MKFFLPTLAITAFMCLSSAAHVPAYNQANHFEDRDVDVCKAVKVIVSLIKKNKATPFCSSFLGITTKTVTVTTATTTTTSISTQVTTIPTTSDTTFTTLSRSTTVFKIIATSTTTLRTTSETITETTIVAVAPTGTLTVTSYYTAGAAPPKRSAAAVKNLGERGKPLPAFLKSYASSAISTACNCLSLATPSTTISTIATSTSVSTFTTTTTSTETRSIFIWDISATTRFYTYVIPAVHSEYSTTTETATTTTPEYATTTTIYRPFPTECTNIIAGGKLYDTLVRSPYQYQMIGYDIFVPSAEEKRSLCCVACWEKPNCMYWHVVATTFCREYTRLEEAPDAPKTDQCPLGTGLETLTGQVTGDPDSPWYGKGPCL